MDSEVHPFRLPLSKPVTTSQGRIDERRGFVFEVEGAVRGLGEATPLPPFTEDVNSCGRRLELAAERLPEAGWPAAFRAVTGLPAARHAVSLAYHDIAATQASCPLYKWLGGEARGSVPVNATIGDAPPGETGRAAARAAAAGFETVKVKVGRRPLDADRGRIERVRELVGDGIAIRVDANGAWERNEAREFIQATRPLDLEYVEQPLTAADLDGHGALREQGIPIALDEGVGVHGVDAIISRDAADALVLKPMALGGPDVARATALTARRMGLTPVISTTIDGVVARTAAIHVAASLPDPPACGLGTAAMLEADLGPDPAPVVDGSVSPPDEPGLGVTEVTI
ncbi:MAG: o-succinylbenzoate synthase [Halodesulfurarchaeum sp.]